MQKCRPAKEAVRLSAAILAWDSFKSRMARDIHPL